MQYAISNLGKLVWKGMASLRNISSKVDFLSKKYDFDEHYNTLTPSSPTGDGL